MLADAARRLARTLLGGACWLCRGPQARGDVDAPLCAACRADLPYAGTSRCPRCALASPDGALCGRCLADPPAYDATVALFAYAFPVDVLVRALKFHGELALAPWLGAMLGAAATPAAPAALLVPVPLSDARLVERGFNQALELARAAAAAAHTPLAARACMRVRDTASQVALPPSGRARNVRGAFACEAMVAGLDVALVDDVMTTGATLDELARVLKRAGAARVVNWVVARTDPAGA